MIRAPTAAGLLVVATSWRPSQLLRLPPSLRRRRGLAVIGDQHVQVAIIIEVTDSHASSRKFFIEYATGLRAHVFEGAPGILEHQQRFFVLHARQPHLDQIVQMAVDQ